MSMKISLTPGGIEPATFRFIEQNFNHCTTAVPIVRVVIEISVNKYDIVYKLLQAFKGF